MGALDVLKDLAGPVPLADGDQEAGGLGDREGQQPVDDRRDHHDAEHELPGFQSHHLAALVAARGVQQTPVDQL